MPSDAGRSRFALVSRILQIGQLKIKAESIPARIADPIARVERLAFLAELGNDCAHVVAAALTGRVRASNEPRKVVDVVNMVALTAAETTELLALEPEATDLGKLREETRQSFE